MKKLAFAIVTLLFATPAYAQDFVTECTLDNTNGDEILCQTNGVWGTCLEENGVPDCGIAYCPSSAARGDACVVAGEAGGCIPICEVDFDVDCMTGGAELVCEIGSTGTFDDGEEINCATGSGAAGPSLVLIALAGAARRRRRSRN